MTETKQEGEYRNLTPQEIGHAITTFRKMLGMKQITLALDAGVDERTVQRIERGEKANDDTLRRVAKVLGMHEGAFLGPRYVSTREEAIAKVEGILSEVLVIDASEFTTVRDCDAVLGAHGYIVNDQHVSHDLIDTIAGFKDLLEDWDWISHDLSHTEAHALQPRELYKTQQYATAVYRSELAHRLKELGYEIERGESSQPEIKGYNKEYLEASSPRRQQIKEHLAKENQRGAGAAQIAAHQTREGKLELSHEEMQERHKIMAAQFGNQPERVVETARERREQLKEEPGEKAVGQALTYSREKNLERDAVAEERALLRDALKRSMGDATVAEVKAEFEKRVQAGEFIETSNRAPGRAFTTEEMIHYEHDTIQMMRTGQQQRAPIANFETRRATEQDHSHLSASQRAAVEQILSSHDQVTALEGVAGAGKTTSLTAIREAAEREGYKVEGFAPTSRAAQKLGEAGIESSTLQRHLTRSEEPHDGQKRLYVLDESSLASTKQMNEFLHRLKENDRVLLVGDSRQHEAVEAGRPYQQLQGAGIETARLDQIVRQKDPALREVVEQLSRGQVRGAMEKLDAQGRVHEIPERGERLKEIAREYAKKPEGTLVVSPDNQSRRETNEVIHRTM
jgi:transcriptional regulator with XRE-family HTH domain/flagellar biosynthesis GTPase FlhF